MIPTKINVNKFNVKFKLGDDLIVYETETNTFLEETGLTIQNIGFPFESEKINYILLSGAGTTFKCGNALNNIFLTLKKEFQNEIVIIDFLGVEETSDYFFENYTKFLLETTNKIITINMSVAISNAFSSYVYSHLSKAEEEEE